MRGGCFAAPFLFQLSERYLYSNYNLSDRQKKFQHISTTIYTVAKTIYTAEIFFRHPQRSFTRAQRSFTRSRRSFTPSQSAFTRLGSIIRPCK